MIRIPILIIFLLSLAAAAYLGFASIHLPHDKAVHFATFCILTAEFYLLFDTTRVVLLRLITVAVCTLGASVASEMVQGIVNPSRVFDIGDIYANVMGSCTGLIACIAVEKKSRQNHVAVELEDIRV